MNATTLKKLYEVQLEEDLKPPVRAHVDRRATRCMLYISRRMPAGELKETNAGRIWIWSDLHLGHTETISSFARPFASSQEMDDALFRSWHRTVSPGDTIICLGDTAIHGCCYGMTPCQHSCVRQHLCPLERRAPSAISPRVGRRNDERSKGASTTSHAAIR